MNITSTADQDSVLDAKIEGSGLTREQYVQGMYDNQTNNLLNEKYDGWFRSLDLPTKKAIYDANQ